MVSAFFYIIIKENIPFKMVIWGVLCIFIVTKTSQNNGNSKIDTCFRDAAVAQLVEHQLPKLRVAGSSPVCRSAEYQALI